jgi:hypothetical protein
MLVLILIISAIVIPVTAEPLANNRHIFINVANDAGVKFNLDGAKYGGPSNTYYMKADGGGLNELHITTDPVSSPSGQVTESGAQSGTFYVSNTGGRGFDNDIILLIAVREPVPSDFSVQIKSSGNIWTPATSGAYTPAPPTEYSHVTNAVSETFTKADLIYGPQIWKPGPGALGDLSLPIYNGQDISNTSDTFQLMFVDLKVGNMRPGLKPDLIDNGAVKIEYSFTNLHTFAAFNAYGWCSAANQDQGISWTNPTRDFEANGGNQQSGQSGYSVTGVPASSSGGGSGTAVLPKSGSAVPVNPDMYGYKGKSLSTFKTGTVNGSVRFFTDPDNKPLITTNRVRDINLSVDLPPGSNVTLARMYMYLSESHNLQTGKGVIPTFDVLLDKKDLEQDQMYIDTDGDFGNVSGTYAFNVREMVKGNGTNIVSVRNRDPEQSVFTIDGVLLVTAYENASAPVTSYWISEGCDVVQSMPEKGLLPEDTTTSYPFTGSVNMSLAGDANLCLVSTGLDQNNTTEHTVRFNDGTWNNILDTGNASMVTSLPVEIWLNETGNRADVQSAIHTREADYLVNRNAFLIVENRRPEDSAGIGNSGTSGPEQGEQLSNSTDTGPVSNQSRSCRVALDSDPEGALVYVDGMYLGKTTPYTLDAEEGDYHTVRFVLDGYLPSETSFTATNTTRIRSPLYTEVHSSKGRMAEVLETPGGSRYGGLYVNSRPSGALISIDGASTGKTTPSVIMGLQPGSRTVKLTSGQGSNGAAKNEFVFEEQTVQVLPEVLIPVDINGIGYHLYTDLIIDSRAFRGFPFTVNGYVNNRTIPARITAARFDSFFTIRENASYVSYDIPAALVEDNYRLIKPRDYQNLSISVNSNPRGAEVFIDGFLTGYTTPYTFGNISDGPHRIMVTKKGYKPQQSLIDLPRRTNPISLTPVDFDLEEYPSGFLYVNSVPEGGKISIDGLPSGELTPALFKSMAAGTHSVTVTGINGTRAFDVTINSVEMTNVTADFTPHEDE